MAEENREYGKVVQYIKGLLAEGALSVGDRLPPERAIAGTLSISRNSTREALRVLGNMGMLESRQGSGNYLKCDITRNVADSLEMMLAAKSTNQLEISRFRRYMELAAFNIAFDGGYDFDTAAMGGALDTMARADGGEKARHDREFHYLVLRASRNALMIGIMDALSEICEDFVGHVLSSADEGRRLRLSKAHGSLLESVKDKNRALGIQAINAHYDVIDELINTREIV